jgi:hypothetical protein
MRATIALLALALCACRPDRGGTESGGDAALTTPSAGSPHTTLDAIDNRTAVPLLPMMANHQKQNMRDHLVAIHEIVAAIPSKDFAGIQRSANRISYSEQMGQMCSHMGAGAPGFTEAALRFHRTADKIGEAAKKSDLDGVLRSLDETLATCTSCHAVFKQHVVDESTWTATTRQSPPLPQHR